MKILKMIAELSKTTSLRICCYLDLDNYSTFLFIILRYTSVSMWPRNRGTLKKVLQDFQQFKILDTYFTTTEKILSYTLIYIRFNGPRRNRGQ